MRLNDKIRTSIRANFASLLNEQYCATTDEMYEKMRKAISDELSKRDDFKERLNLLKRYPCYVEAEDRIDLIIFPKKPLGDKVAIRLDFKFARKFHMTDSQGYSIYWDTVSELELSKETGELIKAYTRRLEDNYLMRKRIDDVFYRVTTSKQLLREIPSLSVFFDEDGEFIVPDFGD